MTDFFDPLLSLEEDFYKEGYKQGYVDGEQAGLIEGRVFGLEKGFEKFLELGRMQGRCSIWNTRFQNSPQDTRVIPPEALVSNPRAQKNIQSLSLLLTNPPFKNDEGSVEEIEEVLKRGKSKTKLVERIFGEKDFSGTVESSEQSIEDNIGYDNKSFVSK